MVYLTYMKAIPILIGPILALVLVTVLAVFDGKPSSLSGAVIQASDVPSEQSLVFSKSDILFSPRSFRSDWQVNFKAFGANRIAWTYDGVKYVGIGTPLGIPVQCALPTRVPIPVRSITRTPDGVVTRVDTSDPNRTIALWNNQAGLSSKFIPAGSTVTVGTTTYLTVADTTVGNLNLPKSALVTPGANVYLLTAATSNGCLLYTSDAADE